MLLFAAAKVDIAIHVGYRNNKKKKIKIVKHSTVLK